MGGSGMVISRSCHDDCELPLADMRTTCSIEPSGGFASSASSGTSRHLRKRRWSSLWHRLHGDKEGLLDEGPLTLPSRWRGHVQRGQTETELEALRRSVVRSAPFGESSRQQRTAKKLGLLFDAPPRWPPAENAAQRKNKTIAVGTAGNGGPYRDNLF